MQWLQTVEGGVGCGRTNSEQNYTKRCERHIKMKKQKNGRKAKKAKIIVEGCRGQCRTISRSGAYVITLGWRYFVVICCNRRSCMDTECDGKEF